jgi:hypothetical protein
MPPRYFVSAIAAFVAGSAALWLAPFPGNDPVLSLIRGERPHLFTAFQASYSLMLFTTPFIVCSVATSLFYIFFARPAPGAARPVLPPYPVPIERSELFVILGEVHREKQPTPIEQDRVVVIEDTSEIELTQTNVVRLEARRAQQDVPAVTVCALLKMSLRLKPDRIVIGEIRGEEAFEFLQALNTGHPGGISTTHANSAVESLEGDRAAHGPRQGRYDLERLCAGPRRFGAREC